MLDEILGLFIESGKPHVILYFRQYMNRRFYKFQLVGWPDKCMLKCWAPPGHLLGLVIPNSIPSFCCIVRNKFILAWHKDLLECVFIIQSSWPEITDIIFSTSFVICISR